MDFKLFQSIQEMDDLLQNNEPRLVRAGSQEICVIKKEGHLIAFRNECPHLGETLHRGTLNAFNEITCPLHAYRFSLATGEEVNDRCAPLRFVKVISGDDGIFLRLK